MNPQTEQRYLDAILAAPGQTQDEIAERLGLTKSTISYGLKELRGAGRIRRDVCEHCGAQRWFVNDYDASSVAPIEDGKERTE